MLLRNISCRKSPYSLLSAFLVIVLFVTIFFTYKDYGISWDEPRQQRYGELVLGFFASQFSDLSFLDYHNLRFYGGFFDLFAVGLQKVLPGQDPYDTRHLLNAMFGLLTIVGCGRLARLLGGEKPSFWAMVALASYPLFYGHMFMNPKDVPFACGYIWSLYYLCKFLMNSKPGWMVVLKFALALGLMCGVRVGGAIFLGYVGVGFILRVLMRGGSERDLGLDCVKMVSALGLAYVIMLAFWPFALLNPWSGPFEAYKQMANFDSGGIGLIAGVVYQVKNPPLWYLPVIMLAQMPEYLLVLLLVFPFVLRTKLRDLLGPRGIGLALTFMAFSVPLVFVVLKGSTLYDNFRHLLFVIPPLFVLFGLGLARTLELSKSNFRYALVFLVSIALLVNLGLMVSLHPYQYVYYNLFAGGKVQEVFEKDYWATGFREALRYIDSRAQETTVVTSSPPYQTARLHAERLQNLRYERNPKAAKYKITLVRNDFDTCDGCEEIYRIERRGITMVKVYALK